MHYASIMKYSEVTNMTWEDVLLYYCSSSKGLQMFWKIVEHYVAQLFCPHPSPIYYLFN